MIINTAPSSQSTNAIRVYLATSAATGSDGAAVPLIFDAISQKIAANDASLDTGRISAAHDFTACIQAKIRFVGIAGLSSVHAYLYREPTGGGADELLDHVQSNAQYSGAHDLRLFSFPALAQGDKIRIDIQSDGAGAVSIKAGDGVTYIELRAL